MKKRTWLFLGAGALILLAAALIILLPSSGPGGTYENLILNGDFEARNAEGLPLEWYTDAYSSQMGTRYLGTEGKRGLGVSVVNPGPNDARFAQIVSVSPDTLYRLQGYVKADAEGGLGANLSIEGVYVFSSSVYDTEGEWQQLTLYGRTGPHQHTVTVYARLGGYSGEATGQAWFDDVTLCRVDNVPNGYLAEKWYLDTTSSLAEAAEKEGTGSWLLIICALAYGALFALMLPFLREEKITLTKGGPRERISWPLLAGLMILAAAVHRNRPGCARV